MGKAKTLLVIALTLSVIAAVFTFFDFPCLHDIHRDYVSRFILDYLEVDIE